MPKAKEGTRVSGNEDQKLPFFGTPAGNLYYGVELELEIKNAKVKCKCPGESKKRVYDGYQNSYRTVCSDYCLKNEDGWKKLVIDKLGQDWAQAGRDGTINFGMEIRTAPSSLKIHRERWKPLFESEELITSLAARFNCGLHIHTDREFLAGKSYDKYVYRVADLITKPGNKAFFTKLFGRGPNDYNRYQSTYVDYRYTNAQRPSNLAIDTTDKYSTVHEGPYTIEFRGFPATTEYSTLIANIETVMLLLYFSKAKNDGSLDEFKQFMQERLPRLPCLSQRLAVLGWLEDNGLILKQKVARQAASA